MKNLKQPTSLFPFFAKLFAMGCSAMASCSTFANVINLCTKTGQSISISLSDYTYEEREAMSLKAKKLGITYTNTYVLDKNSSCLKDGWFMSGQIHFANGEADYQSPISGTLNNTPNWYVRSNALIGKDYFIGAHVLSPHIGLGFRYLHNDLRTNDFRQGYRRDNFLTYVPVGLTHRTLALNRYLLTTTIEYSHLIKGTQKASLSDQNLTAQNVKLIQSKAYGLSLKTMMQLDDWAFGPEFIYWNVDRSSISGLPSVYEPKNSTIEIGFKILKNF